MFLSEKGEKVVLGVAIITKVIFCFYIGYLIDKGILLAFIPDDITLYFINK